MKSRSSSGILFVCTGNICRSPIAEGLFRARCGCLPQAWRIDSAGLHARDGLAPTPQAVSVAAALGADIAGLRSRAFEAQDFARYEHIVAMDAGHLDLLTALAPTRWPGCLGLLRDTRRRSVEVPDPYGRTTRAYRRAGQLIAQGIEVLLEDLAGG